MRKKLLAMLLTMVMLVGLLPMGALAAGDPTEIATANALKQLANAAEGSQFILTADITLPSGWEPITVLNDDLGLDGNGYTITLDGTPLFGNMGNCTVTNLILDGQVTSDNSIASLATGGRGIIRNCISYADVTYTGAAGSNWVAKYAAGLINYTADGGSLKNCVYAGVFTPGQANAYGAMANIDYYDLDIKNCIAVGSDRIGTKTGMSVDAIPTGDTNTLLGNLSDFTPADYVSQLNANRAEGDLEWEVKDGRLSLKRGAEAPEATAEEIAALQAAVNKTVDTGTVYTADSWSAYSEALTRAQGILEQTAPKQNAVTSATATLNAACSGLTERSLSAVDLSGQEVTSITTVSGLEYIQSGKYYRLDADIEITSADWYFPGELNAVVDGNGHTITISAKNTTLWTALGSNAVVQNLGVKGSVSSSNNAGAIAQSSQGLIVNCWSTADVTTTGANNNQKHTGGLVGELKSGGAIVNSYVVGDVAANGSNGGGSAGVLAGSTEGNSLLQTCYGLTDNFKGTGEGAVRDCAVKTRKDFYSQEFIALLNQNRGSYGKEWTLSSEGYPHLGEEGTYTPPEARTVTFTYQDGRVVTFKSDEGLTVSLQDASGYAVGKFSMDGAARWQDTIVGNKDVLLVNEGGTLNIYKAGSADVVAISSEADGSKELVRFTVTVVEGEAVDGFRLTLNGTPVGNSLTLQGSEQVTLIPEIQKNGTWSSIATSLVHFSEIGPLHRVNSTIYAEEPGNMTLTATYMGKTVTVNITSQFVPVTSIMPAPNGTYTIHQRNTNAQPLGAFINLTLSDGAGTVTILPENASYRDKWTMTSSDNDIAEYVSSMLVAVLPKKAGTVTLTAVVEADGQQRRVTGTSQITIAYKNPVTNVAVTGTEFTVKEGEEQSLPITFSGPKTSEGLRVTEPAMNWSFTSNDGGEVEIVTDGSPIVTTQLESGTLLCEANDKYKLIGVTEGTVTVTGTTVDQTGRAKPVTFTVIVESGAPLVPADNAALTTAGIANGKTYLTNPNANYAYGNEWEIFSLRRAGQTIPQEKIDTYLSSVESTYKNSPDATAMKPTTIARVALTLGALGQNAADFRGLNFAEMLYNSTRIGEGGNEPMWALVALDSRGYNVPANALWTRDKLVTELIVKYQASDGGFGLNDNRTTSVDMTAMAVQALAPYYNTRQDVKTAVDKALAYLKGKMDRSCGFDGNAEATAQVVIALTALGRDPVDSANGFVRNEAVNLLTNLTGFAHESGGYKHYTSDQGAQPMSTTQVLMAFEAYRRLAAGATGLYDLTDAADVRSVLAQRVAEAGALKESDYTAESWSTLQTAVTQAQTALDDASSDDAALQAADAALSAALAGLKPASTSGGSDPATPAQTITVSFRVVGDTKHNSADEHDRYMNWVHTMSVTVPAGSTVYDAFAKALNQQGMRFKENQNSYISGIQAPAALGSYWLQEHDNGPNSGWKYLVNGSYPNVGLRYYWLKDGDSIVWRYVDDYTDPVDNTTKWQEVDMGTSSSGAATEGGVPQAKVMMQKDSNGENVAKVELPKGATSAIATIPTAKLGNGNLLVIVKADGTEEILKKSLVEGENAYALVTADCTVKLVDNSKSFTDTAGHWAKDSIAFATSHELFQGTAANTFSPDMAMSRAMLAAVLYRLEDAKASGGNPFADVPNGTWYTDAVTWASASKIVSGTGSGFAPDRDLTRQELVTMLYRYAKSAGMDTGKTTSISGYADSGEVADWASEAMSWAVASGLINGRSATRLAPTGTATRAEVATIMQRLVTQMVR